MYNSLKTTLDGFFIFKNYSSYCIFNKKIYHQQESRQRYSQPRNNEEKEIEAFSYSFQNIADKNGMFFNLIFKRIVVNFSSNLNHEKELKKLLVSLNSDNAETNFFFNIFPYYSVPKIS